ncbi:MAG: mandelate racemase/muconate lactonizing enzyme family protein [Salinirussus sp.]
MWQELDRPVPRPPDRDIEITDVRTMAVRGNPRADADNYAWGLVKLETDTHHHGVGETFRGIAPLDVVDRMADTVIGENPLSPERIAERLQRAHYTATGGIGRAAIAGIEMACWDLKGKVLDVPLYELLGGPFRSAVQLYSDAEALAGEAEGIDFEAEYTPDAYAAAAREVVDEGFQALKFDLDVPTPDVDPEDRAARRLDGPGIDHKVALVEAVREAVGDDVDLGMDLHWSYTVETANRLGRRLEPYDLAFLEDPVHHEKLDAQARVKTTLDVPILTGENITDVSGFLDALQADVLDIAAPDVAMAGGLAALRRIAAVCDAYGVPLAPHNLGSPVATIAGAHLGAAIQNFYALEFRGGDAPWWAALVEKTHGDGPLIEGGKIDVPEGPGLGIEITPEAAEYVLEESAFVF